jgi:hypothetical protein
MSSIFGGSSNQTQSQNQSSNQAFPEISSSLIGNVNNGAAANSQIANLLGLNGQPAQTQGFQNFNNSTGYQFGLNQGEEAVNGNAAAQGLLGSGATAKALTTYGQNYANTQYGNYTNLLNQQQTSGNQSGSVIGGTGQQSSGTSSGNATSKNNPFTSIFGNGGGGAAAIGQGLSGIGSFFGSI